jgi:hypothetical protein
LVGRTTIKQLILSFRRTAGMHNEFVGTRAPRAAAFVCFKAAEEGGEFLIADGRRMFRDLDSDLVDELYNRNIRYSVMELPFFGWVDNFPEPARAPVMGALKGVVSAAINAKVDFDVELLWGEGGYDKTKMLQARAPSQPPIVIHPTTGEPTWFCNVHSHSSKLRKDRESMYVTKRRRQRSEAQCHTGYQAHKLRCFWCLFFILSLQLWCRAF